jgi:hypothetical protein
VDSSRGGEDECAGFNIRIDVAVGSPNTDVKFKTALESIYSSVSLVMHCLFDYDIRKCVRRSRVPVLDPRHWHEPAFPGETQITSLRGAARFSDEIKQGRQRSIDTNGLASPGH